jgi:hypothetical protein
MQPQKLEELNHIHLSLSSLQFIYIYICYTSLPNFPQSSLNLFKSENKSQKNNQQSTNNQQHGQEKKNKNKNKHQSITKA